MNLRATLRQQAEAVVDLLFPPACGACGAILPALELLCADCAAAARRIAAPLCPACGLPGALAGCRDCADLEAHGGRGFDRARALYVYAGPVEQAVHRAKFGDGAQAALAAGRALAAALRRGELAPLDGEVDAVLAIPVGRRRLAERGYDQAALLARELARALGRPFLAHALQRPRETAPQATLGRAARAGNVADAFAVAAGAPLRDRQLLLVDDVLTTGHTASAAARALRAAGARRIDVVTLARATVDDGARPG